MSERPKTFDLVQVGSTKTTATITHDKAMNRMCEIVRHRSFIDLGVPPRILGSQRESHGPQGPSDSKTIMPTWEGRDFFMVNQDVYFATLCLESIKNVWALEAVSLEALPCPVQVGLPQLIWSFFIHSWSSDFLIFFN